MSEKYQPLSELLPSFFDDLLTGPPPVIYQTGIVPVRRGEVLTIGSPPGYGKTALVMAMTTDALHHHPDLSAVVGNVEMTWRQLAEREVSRVSGVPYDWILNRQFRTMPALVSKVEQAQTTIAAVAARMTFLPRPITLEAADRVIDQTGARWVVLDYIQRIPPYDDPARNSPDMRLRLGQTMDLVRGLAEQGRAVLVVSAVGRGSGPEPYSNLGLGSFRESSEVEFSSDSVATLNHDSKGNYRLKIHKGRYQRIGEIALKWDGDSQQFTRTDGGKTDA